MSQRKPLPPQERLLALLSYDPQTGVLTRRHNTKAITGKNSKGYLRLSVDGSVYKAHRVIYKMMTGQEPKCVDHRNGVVDDNRWDNLRAADPFLNQGNRRDQASKWGRGVRQIGELFYVRGVKGHFKCPTEAHEAYKVLHRQKFGAFSIYAS